MPITHSTRFSASWAVQVPLALASTMMGHSQMLNVTGIVNVVAGWATVVVLCSTLLLSIIITCVYLLRRFGQELLPEGGDRTRASTRLDLMLRSYYHSVYLFVNLTK